MSSLLLSLSLSILLLSLLLYYCYYYHHHHYYQYEYFLLHYNLRADILVKDTAILMAIVVRPLRREFYVAASSPKLRCRPLGDVNFKRFAIASNRSGKRLVINKICSFITLRSKSPNLSVFVVFTTCRSQRRLFYMNWCMSQYTFIGKLRLRSILRVLY